MVYLLIGTGLLVVLLFYGRAFVNADPHKVAQTVTGVGGALAIALGALLSVRGAVMIGGPLVLLGLGALFPGLRLRRGGWRGGWRGSRPSPGGVSEVDTDTVRMRLDRDSGAMDGEVKRGPHAGKMLSDLAEADLRALLVEAETSDPDAAALLHAYIDRRFGGGGAGAQAGGGGGGRRAAPSGESMSEAEALAVLGLQPGAGADEIRAAHKRLMVKLHPDQGGSSWLAAKLNAARERLVGKG